MSIAWAHKALVKLRGAMRRRPGRKAVLIGCGCLAAILLLAGLLITYKVHSDSAQRAALRAKAANSTITVSGMVQLALAACDRHTKPLQVMVSGKKVYVLEADRQNHFLLAPQRTFGRQVQVKGAVSGTQSVCVYGKSKDTPVLKVSKVELF